jgi:hypothetical protein
MASALHGTYVVSDGDGSYRTELSQTGTVSAVSSSAITDTNLSGGRNQGGGPGNGQPPDQWG